MDASGSHIPRTTQWSYTLDDLTASMTAVNSTTGNQTTTWAYGTTSTSGVFRNDLLASVTYPDSVSGSDVVSYTYNRLGQTATITDQRGTVRTPLYDKLGRQTDDCVTTVGTGTDTTVLRISRTYEPRGMVATVSSFDNATPGSGTVLNQCALTYNAFRQLTEEQQEHSGAVTGSSANVQYGYASGTGSTNYIRPINVTYPNGRVISFIYAAGRDTNLNRVSTIQDPSAVLARYTYLGLGTVVRIAYPQPLVWLDLWGGTSGVFSGLDLFNRIIDQRWQNNTASTPTDIDRYQYGYDQHSNRLWKANLMTSGLDEFYAYDPLNRLTLMQRGTLNTGKTGITGTPVREMDWTLDITGNWPAYLTKTSGTTDLNQTRTSNTVNEITAVGGTPTWVTPAYDPAGNTTTMPQPGTPTSSYVAVYDAWNRMVKISAGGSTVATYAYDGRNRRSIKVTISPSETRHFYFTNSWQDVEERVGASTSMDKQCVWGIRYIDELVCRDDATPLRLFAMQDANFNLTGISNTSGIVQERYRFDPYGTRTIMSASWSAISLSAYSWVVGHQGLLHDEECRLVYTRARYLNSTLGRMMSREPYGGAYVDGPDLYQAQGSNPVGYVDPWGLATYMVFGPPAMAIGWIETTPGQTLLNAVSNPAPPTDFLPDGNGAQQTVGAWEGNKQYRDVLTVQVMLECDCDTNTVVNSSPTAAQEVGYTPQPGGLGFTQGQGKLHKSEAWLTDRSGVIFTAVAQFRVNAIENAGQAPGNHFQRLPWAWQKIRYTFWCDGTAKIKFGGSFVPSESYYIDNHQVGGYSMVTNGAGITAFMNGGYGNYGPGKFGGTLTGGGTSLP